MHICLVRNTASFCQAHTSCVRHTSIVWNTDCSVQRMIAVPNAPKCCLAYRHALSRTQNVLPGNKCCVWYKAMLSGMQPCAVWHTEFFLCPALSSKRMCCPSCRHALSGTQNALSRAHMLCLSVTQTCCLAYKMCFSGSQIACTTPEGCVRPST